MDILFPVPLSTPNVHISQRFGQDFYDPKVNGPHYKTLYNMNGHNGWDIAAPRGTQAYCPHDAYLIECTSKDTGFGLRLTFLWQDGGYWWMCVLGHFLSVEFENKPFSFYDRSQFIPAGTKIAKIDSSGDSNGDHVHIGLYQYQVDDKGYHLLNSNNGLSGAIDPGPYLKDWVMSNVYTVLKIKKDGTKELAYALPATNEAAAIDKAINLGYPLPKKAPDKVDWDNFKPEYTINE